MEVSGFAQTRYLFSPSTFIFSRDGLLSTLSSSPPHLIPNLTPPITYHLQLLSTMANDPNLAVKSDDRVSKQVDRAMDKQTPSNGHVEPGLSIRMGPVDDMEVDAPATNGNANGKRKARSSLTNTYKEASSSEEDDKPLVRSTAGPFVH